MSGRDVAKREPLRITLYRTKTLPELVAMLHTVKADPESKRGASGLNAYNTAALKKMDEITWAMYYIRQRESVSDGRMQVGSTVIKNW